MEQNPNSKRYDLEERTYQFAKDVGLFVKTLQKTVTNQEYSGQVVRSAGSTGANYIEANGSLGKKDFLDEDQNLSERSEGSSILVEAYL
jgi:four helix bundle protein